jgi:hypothetical protein
MSTWSWLRGLAGDPGELQDGGMRGPAMLEIARRLPPGALIGGDADLVVRAVRQSGGARFVARQEDLIRTGDTITGWHEADRAVEAVATGPNTGNSRFDAGPPGAVICQKGLNCGFVVPGFAPEVDQFTMALIYGSDGEAKTLAAVSTGPTRNVIFLSESEGRLLAKDKHNTVEVSLRLSSGRTRLVIASFDGRRLHLRLGGQTGMAEGRVPDMGHRADFLIGCRTNRPGLTRMLGASRLHEVFFWPDRALLGTDAAEDRAVVMALERYHRWDW